MKTATIELTWTKSVSADVKEQHLSITQNDEKKDYVLFDSVEKFSFKADENVNVHITLAAWDGTYQSRKAKLDFVVPDLERPAAPTGLGWKITDVEDKMPEY